MLRTHPRKNLYDGLIKLTIEDQFLTGNLIKIKENEAGQDEKKYYHLFFDQGQYYLLNTQNAYEGVSAAASILEKRLGDDLLENEKPIFYKIKKDKYKKGLQKKSIQFHFATDLEAAYFTPLADAFWQTACGLILKAVNVDVNGGLRDIMAHPGNFSNIASQTGYPILFGLFAAIYRYLDLKNDFKRKMGRDPILEEKFLIEDHCISYGTSVCLSIAGWEAGLVVGQCLITLFSLTAGAGVPLLLAFCAGLGQAMTAIALNKQWDTALFCMHLISGAVWQATSMLVPFISHLSALDEVMGGNAKRVLGSVTAGIVTFFAERWINQGVPQAVHKLSTFSCRFFTHDHATAQSTAEPETQYADALANAFP